MKTILNQKGAKFVLGLICLFIGILVTVIWLFTESRFNSYRLHYAMDSTMSHIWFAIVAVWVLKFLPAFLGLIVFAWLFREEYGPCKLQEKSEKERLIENDKEALQGLYIALANAMNQAEKEGFNYGICADSADPMRDLIKEGKVSSDLLELFSEADRYFELIEFGSAGGEGKFSLELQQEKQLIADTVSILADLEDKVYSTQR